MPALWQPVDTALLLSQAEEADLIVTFEDHVIQGSCVHKIGPRDNLWVIANDYYNVPFWLLRQYNPDITLDSTLRKGQPINIPIVKAKRSGSSTRPSRSAALACDKELISQRSR